MDVRASAGMYSFRPCPFQWKSRDSPGTSFTSVSATMSAPRIDAIRKIVANWTTTKVAYEDVSTQYRQTYSESVVQMFPTGSQHKDDWMVC